MRFVRRLIAERRIEFVKVGRHVRIGESAIADFIEAGRVDPIPCAEVWPGKGVAEWLKANERTPAFRQRPQARVRAVSDSLSGPEADANQRRDPSGRRMPTGP